MVVILKADCRLPNEYSGAFSYLCQNCRGEILRHIRDRRERLKRGALERLPVAEAAALGLYEAAVLDSKASLVIQALERRGFYIPSPLRLDTCLTPDHQFDHQSMSMYHQSPLNSPFGNLDAIFGLGFRDFDLPLEKSPLLSWFEPSDHVDLSYIVDWQCNSYRACTWFIEHGANLWDPIPRNICAATAAHYLYNHLGILELEPAQVPKTIRPRIHQIINVLSTHDVRDDCHCRCSPGGCSPFVWFLRSNILMSFELHDPSDDHKQELIIGSFPCFLDEWKPKVTVEQLRSAVRYLTFEMLGIRHTCSHDYAQADKPTADEIEELMSEDVSLLELLEELVENFDSKLQSFITEKDPLGLRFWYRYWPQRMEEIMTDLEEDRMGEDELLATQQLGVTWHQLEESPEDCQIPWRTAAPYRESDWSIEVDKERMWLTLGSLEDWRSRLDLIMSRAIPDWR